MRTKDLKVGEMYRYTRGGVTILPAVYLGEFGHGTPRSGFAVPASGHHTSLLWEPARIRPQDITCTWAKHEEGVAYYAANEARRNAERDARIAMNIDDARRVIDAVAGTAGDDVREADARHLAAGGCFRLSLDQLRTIVASGALDPSRDKA